MAGDQVTKEVRTLSMITSVYGWVMAVLCIPAALFFFFVVRGVVTDVKTAPTTSGESFNTPEITEILKVFTLMPMLTLAAAIVIPVLYIAAGSCMKRGKAKWLIYLAAALALFNVPLGLALGIYTFVVLGKTENQQGFA